VVGWLLIIAAQVFTTACYVVNMWAMFRRDVVRERRMDGVCAAGLTLVAAGYAAEGDSWDAAFYALLAVLFAWIWWRRRRRDRAPRSYGAKTRALLAAVVAKLRETLKPRPVLRPAPGGAG
jgi:hypothetical protein